MDEKAKQIKQQRLKIERKMVDIQLNADALFRETHEELKELQKTCDHPARISTPHAMRCMDCYKDLL